MKIERILLSLCLSIALESCALTRSTCEMPLLPERPVTAVCVPNAQGLGQCYDSRQKPPSYTVPNVKNYICIPSQDNQSQEEWIDSLKKAVGQ